MENDDEGEIPIGFKENMALVSNDKVELFMHLIDGDFPDYTKVIPQGNPNLAKIDHGELFDGRDKMFFEPLAMLTALDLYSGSAGCAKRLWVVNAPKFRYGDGSIVPETRNSRKVFPTSAGRDESDCGQLRFGSAER
jgi:hypothetical protein